MKNKILKFALQNAIKFNGKANPGAIIGQLMQEDPSIKSKLKELQPIIQEVIKEISNLSVPQQLKRLQELAPELLEEKKKEKKSIRDLPNVGKKVRMRVEPSPSGPLHIGHSYIISLNNEYCKKYKGDFYLRIGDTNPENIDVTSYHQIPDDASWLTDNNVKAVIIQSDRLDLYYEYAEKLFNQGNMYVCTCDPEEFRELVKKSIQCPCRYLESDAQLKRWHDMHIKFQPGEAVVRFKSNLEHKNPAMRDFPLLRIIETSHPRVGKKFRVWPLMNFSVAIDDADMKITHTLRGKDHADNAKRQELIHEALQVNTPEAISVGRIKFEGFEVSCSKTREKIEAGMFEGWDDIRIPFIPALKRRGYTPQALQKFALEIGVTKVDKVVDMKEFFKTLNAFNKDVIDPISNRYFFIQNPVEIKIDNAPEQDIELDLHPENKAGGRKFKTKDEFFITKEDFENLENGELYRLMNCLNFTKGKDHFVFHSLDYETFKQKGKKIIHWLPVNEEHVNVKILMDDNVLVKGIGEQTLAHENVDSVLQMERFGFCRLDKKDEKISFWFCHK